MQTPPLVKMCNEKARPRRPLSYCKARKCEKRETASRLSPWHTVPRPALSLPTRGRERKDCACGCRAREREGPAPFYGEEEDEEETPSGVTLKRQPPVENCKARKRETASRLSPWHTVPRPALSLPTRGREREDCACGCRAREREGPAPFSKAGKEETTQSGTVIAAWRNPTV